MTRILYINPDPTKQSRATTLGCGWMPAVPAEFTTVATAPCVIVSGGGKTVVISDSPPTTRAAVNAAVQPFLDAETAAAATEAGRQTNRDSILTKASAALAANGTYIALASPSAAQVAAQVKLLTRECNGLIRTLLSQFDDVSDT